MERTSIPLGAPATRGDGSLHTNVPERFPPAWAGLELPAPGAAGMQGRREQSRGNTAGRDRQGLGDKGRVTEAAPGGWAVSFTRGVCV